MSDPYFLPIFDFCPNWYIVASNTASIYTAGQNPDGSLTGEYYIANETDMNVSLPVPEMPDGVLELKEGESIVHNGVVWLKGPTSGPYGFYNLFGFRFEILFKKCRFRTFVCHVPVKARYCGFIKVKS